MTKNSSVPETNKTAVSGQALLVGTDTTSGANLLLPAVRALLSVDDACRFLSIGRTRFYQLLASGDLAAVKIGRSTRVRVADLLAFVDALPAAGGPAIGSAK